jgi:hypothetical protein
VHVLSPGQKVTIYKEKSVAAPVINSPEAINSVATAVPAASAPVAPASATAAK